MHDPRDVFEHPERYWDFLTASDDRGMEDQHFDRKEAGRCGPHGTVSKTDLANLRGQIAECLSAFANANKRGGLLALGISKCGEIKGTNHLTDEQRNSLTNLGDLLRNQAAQVRFHPCRNDAGGADRIYLIYTPCAETGICETPEKNPRAWMRQGAQNVPLTESQRDQLRREKRLVSFELSRCCSYHPDDVDRAVLQEFRRVFLAEADYDYTDEEVLHRAGAIERDGPGYAFTNAGILFFAANPQRVLQAVYTATKNGL